MHIVLRHISAQSVHVEGMKSSTIGVKEGHDVNDRDLCVEGVGIFQVIVPNLINITEKFGHALLGRLVTGIVIEMGFVGSLRMKVKDRCGIVSNCLVVEWETSWAYQFGTMVGFVLDRLGVCVCVCVCLPSSYKGGYC